MTVRELIAELEKCDQDRPVIIPAPEYGYHDAARVMELRIKSESPDIASWEYGPHSTPYIGFDGLTSWAVMLTDKFNN